MRSKSLRLHRVCGACTPPQFCPPSAGPHTMSLSWHRSCVCYQTSSPCVLAGPAQRYPCLCPGYRPIYWGTHGGWQRCEGAYWPHHTAQGRHPHQAARVCSHFCSWISRLEDQHIQSCMSQPLLLPTPSAAPVSMPMACSLACSGVTIRVWHSPVW